MEAISSPEALPSRRKRGAAFMARAEPSESVSTVGSSSTSQSCLSPNTNKRLMQQQPQCSGPGQGWPVLDYHMAQGAVQGTLLNNTLQPADSSTWSNWQQVQLPSLDMLNQAAADQHMADSQPQQLTRANSAPELVKLTQADSAAWQQAHVGSSTGGANLPPTSAALLSHRDYWVI